MCTHLRRKVKLTAVPLSARLGSLGATTGAGGCDGRSCGRRGGGSACCGCLARRIAALSLYSGRATLSSDNDAEVTERSAAGTSCCRKVVIALLADCREGMKRG